MTVRAHCSRWMSAAVFALAALCGAAQADSTLDAVLAGKHRSEANRARDVYRHPAETLAFFGIEPDMTVVELWPGRGWYTEILAPYLREKGKLYAAHFPAASTSEYYQKGLAAFKAMLAANPALYDRVVVTELGPPDSVAIAPAGSADAVLTFRNMHNWMGQGNDVKVMQAAFAALKPGGVLGIVEHRAAPGATLEQVRDSGYMTEEMVIKAAEAAGFVLEGNSEINANPRDTRDHPKGVWTLPPSLALGDKDREKYLAIGESDRMTLRFRKPAQ
jgi:predicted methyltransferase